MTSAPSSPTALAAAFDAEGFVCTGELPTVLHLADVLGKPVLLEGPPGVGKTEVAKVWARVHGAELVRLQCYEGLDESRALYEWSYGKQMLYAQLVRERTAELTAGAPDLGAALTALRGRGDAFFSRDFLVERPVLRALCAQGPAVLLVDELDRADEEFEALLLEVLSDWQVSVPELGTLRATRRPRVVLTSNDTRELSDALRRRCLYLHVGYPTAEEERRILARRVPGLDAELARRVVRFAEALRGGELQRAPGVAEVIDWAMALVALGADGLGGDVLRRTLGVLLKTREDVERVRENPPR